MNDTTKKVSQNRIKKTGIVGEVTEKVNKAKAMVFTDYTGLTHKQLEAFKKEIKKADAEYVVAKNTLLKIALGDKAEGQEDKFQKPTGTMFVYGDVVTPLKALAKMMKDMEKPTVKFGWMSATGGSASGGDGQLLTPAEVAKLATLPSKDVLIAQMLGMMKAPIQGFHRALAWNLQKFVMTLDAIAKTKPASAAPIAADKSPKATSSEEAVPVEASAPTEAAQAPTEEEPAAPEAPKEENQAEDTTS